MTPEQIAAVLVALGLTGVGAFTLIKPLLPNTRKEEAANLADAIQAAVWRTEMQLLIKALSDLAKQQVEELHSLTGKIQDLTYKIDRLSEVHKHKEE